MPDAAFQYSICMAPYHELAKQNSSPDMLLQHVITIGNRPLALLHMISADQGFVLEYPSTRDSQDEFFPISCYSLSVAEGRWQSSLLFTYWVPQNYCLTL